MLLILGATVIPVDYRAPSIQPISWTVAPVDFVLNVILFLPLGAALAGRRWRVVIAVLSLLSFTIELVQLVQSKVVIRDAMKPRPTWQRWSVYYVMASLFLLLGAFNNSVQFIYFQF